MKPSGLIATPLPAPPIWRPRRVRRETVRCATEGPEPLGDAGDGARVGVERLGVGKLLLGAATGLAFARRKRLDSR